MSQHQVFTCDECGTQKKETNHWVLGQYGTYRGRPIVSVMSWDDVAALDADTEHFCGTPHAQLWVGKRINEWQQKGE
jgi:hypothetical protein